MSKREVSAPDLKEIHIHNPKNKIKESTGYKVFTVVNTNGSNIDKLGTISQYIDSISLSRHHYNDIKNTEIFKSNKVPSETLIQAFPDKTKLHLSCNLIKNYIDSIVPLGADR